MEFLRKLVSKKLSFDSNDQFIYCNRQSTIRYELFPTNRIRPRLKVDAREVGNNNVPLIQRKKGLTKKNTFDDPLLTSLFNENQRSMIFHCAAVHKAHQERAATRIQASWRRYTKRIQYTRIKSASLVVQTSWRRNAACKVLRRLAIHKAHLEREATKIQTSWRRHAGSTWYMRIKSASLELQALWRKKAACKVMDGLISARANRASTTIQTSWRRFRESMLYRGKRNASLAIQTTWRRNQARKVLEGLITARDNRASTVIQTSWRMFREKKLYRGERRSAIAIQTRWRRVTAYKILDDLIASRTIALGKELKEHEEMEEELKVEEAMLEAAKKSYAYKVGKLELLRDESRYHDCKKRSFQEALRETELMWKESRVALDKQRADAHILIYQHKQRCEDMICEEKEACKRELEEARRKSTDTIERLHAEINDHKRRHALEEENKTLASRLASLEKGEKVTGSGRGRGKKKKNKGKG